MQTVLKGFNLKTGRGIMEVKEDDFVANVYFKVFPTGRIVRSQVQMIHGVVGKDAFRLKVYSLNIPGLIRETPEFKQFMENPVEDEYLYKRSK